MIKFKITKLYKFEKSSFKISKTGIAKNSKTLKVIYSENEKHRT
jgi:hypothetical protein